jgi:hypothetical protein
MFPFFNPTRSACDSPDGSRDGNSGMDIGYLPDPMGMGINMIFLPVGRIRTQPELRRVHARVFFPTCG